MTAGARLPRRWSLLLCAALLCAMAGAGAAPISVSDDRGRTVTLAQPAARIVSLAPHLTELLYEAGAGERLVAVVEYSDYPPAARGLPRIGSALRIDLERIAALAPDLVLAWKSGNSAGDIERIEAFGIPVFVSEPGRLEQIPEQIEKLGRLAGSEATAAEAAVRFRRRLEDLRGRYAARAPVPVFYQIWEQPLMTINRRHFINDALRVCGGSNVFADLEPLVPSVALEAVIAADPLAIAVNAAPGEGDAALSAWRRHAALRAVRQGNLFALPSDLMARPTPRLLDGAELLCKDLERARESGERNEE